MKYATYNVSSRSGANNIPSSIWGAQGIQSIFGINKNKYFTRCIETTRFGANDYVGINKNIYFRCNEPSCFYFFATRKERDQHYAIHEYVKPYYCDGCYKRFYEISHVKQHQQTCSKKKIKIKNKKKITMKKLGFKKGHPGSIAFL